MTGQEEKPSKLNKESVPNSTDESASEKKLSITITVPQFSRRTFLKKAAAIGTSILLGASLGNFLFGTHAEQPTPSAEVSPSPTSENFVLGAKENLSLKEYGLEWTPDGHISYFTTPEGKKRYFISAADSTWMIETQGQKSLKDYILSKELTQEQFHEVLTPTGNFKSATDYKNGYTGITDVLQTDKNNPMHLMGITHYEQRKSQDASDTYTASVGLIESTDGGLTWTDKGQIIKGRDPIPPGEMPSGAGQPAAIIKDGYVHIIYIEWNTGADELYSAKMKINDDGSLGNVEDVKDNNGYLKPVIPMPQGTSYAAVPSLSYNNDLQKYLCIFLTNLGFYETTSDDLVNWGDAKMIFSFTDNNSAPDGDTLAAGQEYIYYPSYLSEEQADDHTTGKNGELYYSSRLIGPSGDGEHNLKSVDLKLAS